jgi:hypothetical protein
MNARNRILAAAALLFLAAPAAQAHHSYSMFDNEKRLLLEGTIKEMQWTNPHAWMQVMVQHPDGKMVEWSIEMASPNQMFRTGWKRNSLSPGDKVLVMTSPLRDGRPGGSLVNATLPTGEKMGRHVDAAGNPITPNFTMADYQRTSATSTSRR